jgi:hypothetical protein
LGGYAAVACSEGDLYLDEPGEWGIEANQRWAAPDLAQAAKWLRRLAAEPGLRRRLGLEARRRVAARPDEEAIGALMAERLERLAHTSISDERRRKRREARLAWASATDAAPVPGGRR